MLTLLKFLLSFEKKIHCLVKVMKNGCVCYFSVTVIKYPKNGNLKREECLFVYGLRYSES